MPSFDLTRTQKMRKSTSGSPLPPGKISPRTSSLYQTKSPRSSAGGGRSSRTPSQAYKPSHLRPPQTTEPPRSKSVPILDEEEDDPEDDKEVKTPLQEKPNQQQQQALSVSLPNLHHAERFSVLETKTNSIAPRSQRTTAPLKPLVSRSGVPGASKSKREEEQESVLQQLSLLSKIDDVEDTSTQAAQQVTNPSVPDKFSSETEAEKEKSSQLQKRLAKLQAEVHVKNKIIHDLTVQETRLKAQIPTSSLQPSSDERSRLFSLLEKFRTDLDQAKEACEQVLRI